MKKEEISRVINGIDEKYINEASLFAINGGDAPSVGKSEGKKRFSLRWGAAAACLVLAVLVGSGAVAVAAEAKEYNDATEFFTDNGLSTEGLSRSEIKAVYRDIIGNRFKDKNTAEVILKNVPGWEIEQDVPTPEELAEIWNNNSTVINNVKKSGISYLVNYQDVQDPELGFDVLGKSILECYDDGIKIWTADFSDLFIDGQEYCMDGTTVWGENYTWASWQTKSIWVARLDGSGKTVWQKSFDHGFQYEYISSVLSNGDGTWTVISMGDFHMLCCACLDSDGNEISVKMTDVGGYHVRNSARFGGGCLIQMSDGLNEIIYKTDSSGNISDTFSYSADDCYYYITDMEEYEGHIYLSAYAVPKQTNEGGRHEINDILSYLFSDDSFKNFVGENGEWCGTSEELTRLVKDNYTAVLLMCDPDSGDPKTFYSVKGSLGGKLEVTDKGLEWDVEGIVSTYFSPFTSSFTVGGTCEVFRYVFDAEGRLTGQFDTGETVPYRR